MSNFRSPDGVAWQYRTAQAIQACGQQDGSVLVVPVGSIEQHGEHLPVGTDTILVEAVATTACQRVQDSIPILVAPSIWSGFSPHHLAFGGTLTLAHRHMMRMGEDVCSSALENGFDALVLLNGHGGNVPVIDSLVSTIGSTRSDSQILGTTYFSLVKESIDDVRESDTGRMAHGGEFETSLLLHLAPELVGEDRPATMLAEPYEHAGQDLHDAGVLSVYRGFEEYSHSGAIGAPEQASAEKGAVLFERIIDELTALLTDVHDANR